jgi:hypothetical protein
MNSGGIKAWLIFSIQLETLEAYITLHGCRRAVVMPMNIIEDFIPKNAYVASFYVPIYCDKCEDVLEVYQEVATLEKDMDHIVDKARPEKCKIFPSCLKHLDFDFSGETYFAFTKLKKSEGA